MNPIHQNQIRIYLRIVLWICEKCSRNILAPGLRRAASPKATKRRLSVNVLTMHRRIIRVNELIGRRGGCSSSASDCERRWAQIRARARAPTLFRNCQAWMARNRVMNCRTMYSRTRFLRGKRDNTIVTYATQSGTRERERGKRAQEILCGVSPDKTITVSFNASYGNLWTKEEERYRVRKILFVENP